MYWLLAAAHVMCGIACVGNMLQSNQWKLRTFGVHAWSGDILACARVSKTSLPGKLRSILHMQLALAAHMINMFLIDWLIDWLID